MRTLVTGAAGFIGSTLVDRLLADGHQVLGIDNLSTGLIGNLASALSRNTARRSRFTFVRSDIQAPELGDIVVGCNPEVVFHLAGQVDVGVSVANPQFDARHNVMGTINLCEAARRAGVQRIVYAASGGSRYGAPASLPVDETTKTNPLSPYGVSKLAGELYVTAYARMYGTTAICLALSNVYGPRQNPRGEAGIVAVFGAAIVTGRSTTIFGDGSATRDFVFVDDAVDAFVRAGSAPEWVQGTYNVGTGLQIAVNDVHRVISSLVNGSSPPHYVSARTGELPAIALDAARAEADLGWRPTVTLAEGLRRTTSWLRSTCQTKPTEAIGA